MPRPRKNDPTPLIRPLLLDFAREVGEVVERTTLEKVRSVLADGRDARVSRRAATRCYFPGCTNVAAPRFGMFCAAVHKDLPAAEKARYKKQRG
jgi:hypothetical protein